MIIKIFKKYFFFLIKSEQIYLNIVCFKGFDGFFLTFLLEMKQLCTDFILYLKNNDCQVSNLKKVHAVDALNLKH